MTYSCIKPPFYDTVSVLEIYVQVTIFLIILPPRIVKVPFPIGILKSKKNNLRLTPPKKSVPDGSCRGPPHTSWPVMTFGHQQNLYYHLVMTMVTKSWPRHDHVMTLSHELKSRDLKALGNFVSSTDWRLSGYQWLAGYWLVKTQWISVASLVLIPGCNVFSSVLFRELLLRAFKLCCFQA
jgi:hypothetical protein